MFTIMTSRNFYGEIKTDYFGTFATIDAGCDAAVKVEATGLLTGNIEMDIVPIPDGVTPKTIDPSYLS